jgi:hypothetical protein
MLDIGTEDIVSLYYSLVLDYKSLLEIQLFTDVINAKDFKFMSKTLKIVKRLTEKPRLYQVSCY